MTQSAFPRLIIAALAALCLLAPAARAQDGQVLNYRDADIRAVIDDVSLVTGYTFIVDPAVTGMVTITSQTPLSQDEFFVGQQPNLGPPGLSVLPLVSVPPNVNTGAMPTERTNLFNVEGAASWGSLLIQSEARWARVDLLDGTSTTFPAAYAHMRYVLTGETIPYNRQSGVFGRVKPAHPVDLWCGYWGAWELAARVSYIDLNRPGVPDATRPGRRLTDVTLGLNWYLSDHTKFQFNYIHADLDDPILGSSQAQTFACRGQLDF